MSITLGFEVAPWRDRNVRHQELVHGVRIDPPEAVGVVQHPLNGFPAVLKSGGGVALFTGVPSQRLGVLVDDRHGHILDVETPRYLDPELRGVLLLVFAALASVRFPP